MRSANDGLNLLTILFSKAVWFLKLYISQYKELLIFIAVFVVLYIFFMHWLNVRFLNRLRQPAALISLAVELGAIVAFTLAFREAGAERLYELERIEGREEAVERLDDVLFHKIPYISDYI